MLYNCSRVYDRTLFLFLTYIVFAAANICACDYENSPSHVFFISKQLDFRLFEFIRYLPTEECYKFLNFYDLILMKKRKKFSLS